MGTVPVGENVSGVNETVEHFRCLLNEVALVGVVLEVIVRLEVEDHVEGLPVVWNLLVQSSQVELVLQTQSSLLFVPESSLDCLASL